MILPEWHDQALCRDHDTPDLWHPTSTSADAAAEARTICGRCPVKGECLTFALADPRLTGVWGGLTDNQRTRLRNAS